MDRKERYGAERQRVWVQRTAPGTGRPIDVLCAHVETLRAANQTLTDLFAAAPLGALNVVIDGEADIASSFGVTAAFFRVLGLNAAAGRTLNEDDHKPGAAAVAVISHAFWRKRFASDPKAINRVVRINGHPVTIVGILPASFGGIQRLGVAAPEVTLPLSMDPVVNVGSDAEQPGHLVVGSHRRPAETRRDDRAGERQHGRRVPAGGTRRDGGVRGAD